MGFQLGLLSRKTEGPAMNMTYEAGLELAVVSVQLALISA